MGATGEGAIARGRRAPRLMIVSDLDNTMVDHQDPAHKSLLRFNALWEAEYAHDSLLVFSTGRSPTLYKQLREHVPLLTPGILIMSVGTEIMYGDTMTADAGWEAILNQGWNRDTIVTEAKKLPNLTFQVETEQRPHKVSFSVAKEKAPQIIETLSKRLHEEGLQVKFIYSGGSDLDILPKAAGKGGALAYLLKKFSDENRRPNNVLACGDSGNDAELFEVQGANGVIVGNAMDELVQWYEKQTEKDHVFRATERCASGIIQAMQHNKFLPANSPRDQLISLQEILLQQEVKSLADVQRHVIQFFIFTEQWLTGQIEHDGNVQKQVSLLAGDDFLQILPTGREVTREEWGEQFSRSYGSLKGKNLKMWVDRMRSSELVPEKLWLLRFNLHQHVEEGGQNVQIATALLGVKDDASHQPRWLQFHTTFAEPSASH